ncbi:MAG TPA: extracellular solute-binding protein [Clostridia bacterium]|nr:extracellular solute-binding protein [Clostridia bacterium]HPK14848.1 extracellular solute-binding protein [Clostridia bacterium]
MKKAIGFLLSMLMVVGIAAGCAQNPEAGKIQTPAGANNPTPAGPGVTSQPEKPVEPVTIRYYDWDLVNQSVIDRFMLENPDIIVEVYDVSANSDRATQLDILAMSGEIDVMPMADGDQFARFEQGMMANLDDLIAAYGIDMEEAFSDYAQWAQMDGGYYAIPYRTSKTALYYNKSIFDAAGVSYPTNDWTREDYTAAAAAISEWGKNNGGVYGTYSHTYGNEWAIMAAQKGDWYTAEGMCNIKDRAWVDALTMRTALDSGGLQMPYSEIKASGTVINSSFLGGKEGMVLAGSWLVRDMKKTDKFPFDFEVGIASVPRWDDTVAGVRGNYSVSVLGIPESSKNKEAAFRFILYLEMQSAQDIAATGNVPCYIPAYDDALIETFVSGSKMSVDQAKFFFDTDVVLTTNKILGKQGASYMSIIKEEIEPYFFGEIELDIALNNIESRVNELLAN